ncbi:hypothetical protein EP073_12020 [Geovibrio thiophilus]|uniref:Uncharacterized protein n=1 Tax=Geovibrio thiophilus TaxID=139438 RepID=A0A3R5Z0M1_9BACT|nr:hypothetical protein [Geovibrio thiophilus]QAR34103.1 hypothetical protein EP073_12020 [Geovibrio thiophilus]
MIYLNGIFLDGMVWTNEFSAGAPSAEAVPCADGTTVVFTQTAEGFAIDLESAEGSGWLTLAEAQLLREAASAAGAVYLFVFRDREYRVRFRHEDEPALILTPVRPASGYGEKDCFYGKIKLKTV